MIAGEEFGIHNDAPSCFASDLQAWQSCHRIAGDNLIDQLKAIGLDYAETLPSAGSLLQAFPAENSAIVVTFDEGEKKAAESRSASGSAGAVELEQNEKSCRDLAVTKCGGPAAHEAPLNHYALLATIEDGFKLPRLRNAKEAPTLVDLAKRPCP